MLEQAAEPSAGTTLDSTYYQYAVDNSLVRRQVATPPSTVVDTYYGYDANGALTQVLEGANATYFGYGANQLVTRILPPAEAATYFSYDGRLNRYYIDKAGTQTYYLWDGLNQLEERDGSGTLLARYTQGNYRQYGIGSVVEVERHVGAATYYQYGLGDHRGTFYKITDQNQNVQLDYTLDAFGRQLAAPGGANPAVPNDLIYQTNWLTLNVGGRAYGISKYRLYDPELGIFLSRDFLGSWSGLNEYQANASNPVRFVDSRGLNYRDANECLNDVYKSQLGQYARDCRRQLIVTDKCKSKVKEYQQILDWCLCRKGLPPNAWYSMNFPITDQQAVEGEKKKKTTPLLIALIESASAKKEQSHVTKALKDTLADVGGGIVNVPGQIRDIFVGGVEFGAQPGSLADKLYKEGHDVSAGTLQATNAIALVSSILAGLAYLGGTSGPFAWQGGGPRALYNALFGQQPNTVLHHWAVPRNWWGRFVPNFIKNAPPNLLRVSRPFHNKIDGYIRIGNLPILERLWYGSPWWAKIGVGYISYEVASYAEPSYSELAESLEGSVTPSRGTLAGSAPEDSIYQDSPRAEDYYKQ